MRELTLGEKRFIDESTNGWKMDIYSRNQEITPEIEKRISELAEAYEDAFYAFYKDALQKEEVLNADAIQRDFDEAYEKEHPEFYDVEALLRGGSTC